MEKDRKKEVAMFRFGVIHPLIGLKDTERMKKEPVIREIIGREWEIPNSPRTHICRATILVWLKRYKASGNDLESLMPKQREDAGRPRKVDAEVELSLANLKSAYPTASLKTLLSIAKTRGMLVGETTVSDQTFYRLLKRHNVGEKTPEDMRKFEAELPNDLWQSDCMHGPMVRVGEQLRKAYLFAIIDDHSRLITHAQFYLHENVEAYMDCLETALAKRGIPRKLYLDNGAAFRSWQLRYTTASLGIALIHATPYRPQGKGKIERWFKTVRTTWLPTIPESLSLEALNERLYQWVNHGYHVTAHSTIRMTPLERYQANIHLVRPAPKHLHDYFRKRVQRKVSRDRTVAIFGQAFEAPISVIGKTVTLQYHEGDQARIEVFDDDRSVGFLAQLNPHINAHVRRKPSEKSGNDNSNTSTKPSYEGGKLFSGGTDHA